ncbi:Uncharacterised protein [Propionibacterium australiense]|uniref:Uncharacterized protein n=1 Tax=Propionibacterium australiense TaxID=119981 RepID=A0A383S735_9ACTN|nr:Hypothetical protein PROPAUS_1666 [Propionibacterium australiense]VEH92773.1 Uncharacterised protein [Propionibacterium australiense]
MEPHLFRWGNGRRASRARRVGCASMEPHLFRWGNGRRASRARRVGCASMEPHLFRWGNIRDRAALLHLVHASMEPHLFRWGNHASFASGAVTSPGLNGAPPIQVGKPLHRPTRTRPGRWPQWSPTYSGGETRPALAGQQVRVLASMEPHLFRWGNLGEALAESISAWASMEPHLFRWGNVGRRRRQQPEERSLNGAPPIQVGKRLYELVNNTIASKPQWSPTYSGGETTL